MGEHKSQGNTDMVAKLVPEPRLVLCPAHFLCRPRALTWPRLVVHLLGQAHYAAHSDGHIGQTEVEHAPNSFRMMGVSLSCDWLVPMHLIAVERRPDLFGYL